jgi:hypothetical protein
MPGQVGCFLCWISRQGAETSVVVLAHRGLDAVMMHGGEKLLHVGDGRDLVSLMYVAAGLLLIHLLLLLF